MANDGTRGAVDATEDTDVDIDMEDDENDVTEGAEPDDAECTVPIILLRMVVGVLHSLETNCCCCCCCCQRQLVTATGATQ